MAKEACLPLIFPYLVDLRRSGNAPEKLIAAFQFVGFFGRRKEPELRPNTVVGEEADRVGMGESWHGIFLKSLWHNFCISCP